MSRFKKVMNNLIHDTELNTNCLQRESEGDRKLPFDEDLTITMTTDQHLTRELFGTSISRDEMLGEMYDAGLLHKENNDV